MIAHLPRLGGGGGESRAILDAVRITIVTIFPEFFESPLDVGIVGRALAAGVAAVETFDLRIHGKGVHRQVDDAPFGAGRAW
jgi:tRNA (guanine37-N1)-methyltransferase